MPPFRRIPPPNVCYFTSCMAGVAPEVGNAGSSRVENATVDGPGREWVPLVGIQDHDLLPVLERP